MPWLKNVHVEAKVCTDLEKMQADYKLLKELYIRNTQSLLEANNQIIKNYNNALDNIRITVPGACIK